MNTCHACKRELDDAAIASRRCPHCGAPVRPLAKRTIEDKSSPWAMRAGDKDSIEQTFDIGKASDQERKHPTVPDRSDMTIDYTVPPPELSGEFNSPSESPSPSDSGDRPTRRSTQSLERDVTIDFDSSSVEAEQL